jgi:AcrR family transcriptional regulator
VRAARQVYAEQGRDAALGEIARCAGVGDATLYRHFPDKTSLIRAALEQGFAEQLAPVIDEALLGDDPYCGLVSVLEAALTAAASQWGLLGAAHDAGALTVEVTAPFFDAMTLLVSRAQQAELVRGDLVAEDLVRITVMLVSVLSTMESPEDGWRRYLELMLAALTPGAPPLPWPAKPLLPGSLGVLNQQQ